MTTIRDFDTLVARLHDSVHCEIATLTGAACRRPASWRINLHGCEQANACGHHKEAWLREAVANHTRAGIPRCVHCGQMFATLGDAFSVTPL